MKNKELHKHIYKFLSNISNSVGDTITEHTWREAAGLMSVMEDKKLVKNVIIQVQNPRTKKYLKINKTTGKIEEENTEPFEGTTIHETYDFS